MERILIRAGVAPWAEYNALDVITDKIIGNNTGNLLFANSITRLVATADSRVDFISDLTLVKKQITAQEINENYDRLILPMANAFREDFARKCLKHWTALIRQLTILRNGRRHWHSAALRATPGAARNLTALPGTLSPPCWIILPAWACGARSPMIISKDCAACPQRRDTLSERHAERRAGNIVQAESCGRTERTHLHLWHWSRGKSRRRARRRYRSAYVRGG